MPCLEKDCSRPNSLCGLQYVGPDVLLHSRVCLIYCLEESWPIYAREPHILHSPVPTKFLSALISWMAQGNHIGTSWSHIRDHVYSHLMWPVIFVASLNTEHEWLCKNQVPFVPSHSSMTNEKGMQGGAMQEQE